MYFKFCTRRKPEKISNKDKFSLLQIHQWDTRPFGKRPAMDRLSAGPVRFSDIQGITFYSSSRIFDQKSFC